MQIGIVPIYNKGATSLLCGSSLSTGPLPPSRREIIMPSNLSCTAPFPLNRLAFGIAFGIGSSLLTPAFAQPAEREIEEVTVTATYLSRTLDEIAGTVSVI